MDVQRAGVARASHTRGIGKHQTGPDRKPVRDNGGPGACDYHSDRSGKLEEAGEAMSEQPGLFSAILLPFVDAANERSRQRRMMRQQRQQQPAEKAVRRAVVGAGVLTGCLWLSPLMLQNFSGLLCGAWAFTAVAGLVALIAGLQEARALVPVNLLAAFWSASVLLGIGWLLLAGMVPADATGSTIVRGLYVTGLAAAGVSFWIHSGLAQRNAQREIERQLQRQNPPMIPARPRRR